MKTCEFKAMVAKAIKATIKQGEKSVSSDVPSLIPKDIGEITQ